MPYNESARDKKVRQRLEAWPVQQFGQSNDYSAFDGATACTQVIWQKVAYIWTGKKHSIDAISKMAGYYRERNRDGSMRGMDVSQVIRLIDRLNLPYVYKRNLSFEALWAAIDKAPVPYATRYGSQPDWKGYVYRGIKANGKPGGFAYKAGRTQLAGFENGPHAVLGAAKRILYTTSGTRVRMECVRVDPNHGSPARPERPPYDLVSSAQVKREYEAYHDLGRSLIAFVPTRNLPA